MRGGAAKNDREVSMPKIAIIGAGAIGGMVGALLRQAGHDVTLICRREQAAAISKGGIKVEGALGSFCVEVPVATRIAFEPEILLLAVKTQDVVEAVKGYQMYLQSGAIITMQNGVRSDELVSAFVPPQRVVGAVVSSIATSLMPGEIQIVSLGSLVIGLPFGTEGALLEHVASVLRDALPTYLSDNIRGARWLKLLINVNNALPAVTGLTVQEVYADPFLRRLVIHLLREGLRVVKRSGIKLASLPEVSVGLIKVLGRLPVGVAAKIAAAKVRRTSSDFPILGSTLQSIKRGRSTEIDYLNGEIVRLGAALGVPTPLNAMIVEQVHQVERERRFFSVEELQTAAHELLAN